MTDELRRVRIWDGRKLQRLVLPPEARIWSWRKQVQQLMAMTTATFISSAAFAGPVPQWLPVDWLEIEDDQGHVLARLQGITSFRDESIAIEEGEWNGAELTWKPAEQ